MITDFAQYFISQHNFYSLNTQNIINHLNLNANLDYAMLKYVLLAWRDKQINITSTLQTEEDIINAQTGVLFKRDATEATPINDRLSQNAPLFHMIDLMQRSLMTMRAIDHALQQRIARYPNDKDSYTSQQDLLKNAYIKLLVELEEMQKKS